MIKQILSSACLVAAVAAAPGVGMAQSPQAGPPLRVQWEADLPRDGVQGVCGRVFNDGSVAAWHVVLLVEGLDGTDHVTNSRQIEVLGDVPSEGYALFCVPEPAGTNTHRVRVIGADWMTTAGRLRRRLRPTPPPRPRSRTITLHAEPPAAGRGVGGSAADRPVHAA